MRTLPLPAERPRGLPRLLCRLWAGLECGVLAGTIILLWFIFHSVVHGEYWWSKFNVAASWFYDLAVYHAGLGRVTLTGASVIIIFYCLASIFFSLVWDSVFRSRGFLAVPFYVVGVHLIASYFFWPSFGPFARLWFPWTATAPAHFVLFAILMRYPILYVRLVNEFGDPGWLPREPLPSPANPVETARPSPSFEAPADQSSSSEPPKV